MNYFKLDKTYTIMFIDRILKMIKIKKQKKTYQNQIKIKELQHIVVIKILTYKNYKLLIKKFGLKKFNILLKIQKIHKSYLDFIQNNLFRKQQIKIVYKKGNFQNLFLNKNQKISF